MKGQFLINLSPCIHCMEKPPICINVNNKVVKIFCKIVKILYCYSLMIATLMVWSFFVTLLLPLVCFKVQMYVPLSCRWTGLTYRLPFGNFLNLVLSSCTLSCLFHSICGRGVPSALQLIIPEASAIILCWWFTSVNLAVGRNTITLVQ